MLNIFCCLLIIFIARDAFSRRQGHVVLATLIFVCSSLSYGSSLCPEIGKIMASLDKTGKSAKLKSIIAKEFSPIEQSSLLALVDKYQDDAKTLDVIEHFMQFIQRYPFAEGELLNPKMTLKNVLKNPVLIYQNLFPDGDRTVAIEEFAKLITQNPTYFDQVDLVFEHKMLSAFAKEHDKYFYDSEMAISRATEGIDDSTDAGKEAKAAAVQSAQETEDFKREVRMACRSSQTNPYKERSLGVLPKFTIAVSSGSTLISYIHTHKDSIGDDGFWFKAGKELMLSMAMNVIFQYQIKKIVGQTDLTAWQRNWKIFLTVGTTRNVLTALIYSQIFNISQSQAQDELDELKTENPKGYDDLLAGYRDMFDQMSKDPNMPAVMTDHVIELQKAEKIVDSFTAHCVEKGLIKKGEDIHAVIEDSQRSEIILEEYYLFQREQQKQNPSEVGLRMAHDETFSLGLTSLGIQIIIPMAQVFLLCHSPAYPLAWPAAVGLFIGSNYSISQLYYFSRIHFLGY